MALINTNRYVGGGQFPGDDTRKAESSYDITLNEINYRSLNPSYVVHTFYIGDVDEPDIYAAEELWRWQSSPAGQWCMEHSNPLPSWHRTLDYSRLCNLYSIKVYLNEVDLVWYKLKYT